MKLPQTGLEIQENVTLAPYTSWLIGGPAQYFCQPSTLDELKESVDWAGSKSFKTTVLSGASNVLIADAGIKGLVILLNKFTGTIVEEKEGRLYIFALAGTAKSEILKIFLRYKLAPSLFLAGIPGDVGGGVVMNAGVGEAIAPREFVEIVDWIRVLRDGVIHTFTRDDLKWSYRHCRGWEPGILVEVGLSWPNSPQEDMLQRVREANANRLKKQPLDKPSCGSVFVNPDGAKAGQLIESCGLKGFRIGDAQVSEKHANFIVNLGAATASDTKKLIDHIQRTVKAQTGISLKTEVLLL